MPFRARFDRKSKEGEPSFGEENPARNRVVIYGNRIDDHVDDVANFVMDWCSMQRLGSQLKPIICRHEEDIEEAFYGLEQKSDIKTIPAIVIAGQNIRIPHGMHYIDKPLERDIKLITDLCKMHNVPLVRFVYDSSLRRPLISPPSQE